MNRDSSATTLTLAVPYYAGFELLLRTLASLAAQTHPQTRVLVCDDSPAGLNDGERARVDAVFRGSVPCRLVRNAQNLGMARTWNRCLDEADSELVTIVHGDDELEPGYASAMIELARAQPGAAAMFCGARIIDGQGAPAFSFPDLYKELLIPAHDQLLVLAGDAGLASLLRGNYIFCPSLCYRKSRLGQRRFNPDYRMVLDFDLTTELLVSGETIVGIPRQRLYRYRRHADNTTQQLTKDTTRFKEEFALYRELSRRARALGFVRSERVARRSSIVRMNLSYCIVRDVLSGQWSDALQKGRLLTARVAPSGDGSGGAPGAA